MNGQLERTYTNRSAHKICFYLLTFHLESSIDSIMGLVFDCVLKNVPEILKIKMLIVCNTQDSFKKEGFILEIYSQSAEDPNFPSEGANCQFFLIFFKNRLYFVSTELLSYLNTRVIDSQVPLKGQNQKFLRILIEKSFDIRQRFLKRHKFNGLMSDCQWLL